MQGFFRSFFTVSFYTFLSRILGFVRDILIARFLGSTITSDAFFVAFRIPNFFRRVLAEGAYSAALIPVFSGVVIDSKNDRNNPCIGQFYIVMSDLYKFYFCPNLVEKY